MQKPWDDVPAAGPLLRIADAAQYLGFKSRSHYYALLADGRVPPPLKLGIGEGGAAGVPQPWLDATIAAAAGGGSPK